MGYDADYALFVYFRDTFASTGRIATMIVASLFTYGTGGAAIGGGEQVGFASLVDLETGDVIWFNVMKSSVGNLRKPDSARESAEDLLTDLPL